jgi:chromosome segregation ATPase
MKWTLENIRNNVREILTAVRYLCDEAVQAKAHREWQTTNGGRGGDTDAMFPALTRELREGNQVKRELTEKVSGLAEEVAVLKQANREITEEVSALNQTVLKLKHELAHTRPSGRIR